MPDKSFKRNRIYFDLTIRKRNGGSYIWNFSLYFLFFIFFVYNVLENITYIEKYHTEKAIDKISHLLFIIHSTSN